MFNFGIPNSFSVYIHLFFFAGVADLVFCCLGGGAFGFFETLLFVLTPRALDFPEPLLPLLSLEKILDLTVLVGAMTYYLVYTCLDWSCCSVLTSEILIDGAKIRYDTIQEHASYGL